MKEDGTMMAVEVQADGSAFKAGTLRLSFKSNPILEITGARPSTFRTTSLQTVSDS